MRKSVIVGMSALLLLSSCETYTGMGAYTGSTLGSIFGSAIGGIAGGPHGSDVGTIVGMVGGAMVGAAVGSASDQRVQQQREEDLAQYRQDKADRAAARQRRAEQRNDATYGTRSYGNLQSQSGSQNGNAASTEQGQVFDPNNSGDDRLYDFNGSDYTGNYSSQEPTVSMPMQSSVENLAGNLKYTPYIEIKNARFIDDNQDGKIERGEMCKVIFEVFNRGKQTLYDIVPTVIEANNNRHIIISPNMHVEQLQPNSGIRYTALVKADNKLKDGSAKLCVSVVQGSKSISKVTEFNVPTVK